MAKRTILRGQTDPDGMRGYLAAAATVLLALLARPAPAPVVVWNASASAPLGFYLVRPTGDLHRGELVLARLPPAPATLAAQRGYLPRGTPVLKRIAALVGDKVCSGRDVITISDRITVRRLATDAEERPLPSWSGCTSLDRDHVFLLMPDVPDSFDGRYFGPIPRKAVIGKATPLWTW